MAAVICYGPCITFLTRMKSKLVRDKEGPINLPASIWFVYGSFIKQGTSLSPEASKCDNECTIFKLIYVYSQINYYFKGLESSEFQVYIMK